MDKNRVLHSNVHHFCKNEYFFILISWVWNFCHCLHFIGRSLVAYQIGYVVDRCPRRQFQTLISQIMQINSIFKEFENLSVEKMTLSTALGFEPRSFDCLGNFQNAIKHINFFHFFKNYLITFFHIFRKLFYFLSYWANFTYAMKIFSSKVITFTN